MRTPKLLFLWLLLLLVDRGTTVVVAQEATAAATEECVVGEDETCIPDSGGSSDACENTHVDCDMWARVGECDANPGFMVNRCTKACQLCDKSRAELEDIVDERKEVLAKEEKRKEEERKNFGISQLLHSDKGQETSDKMKEYMTHVVMKEDRFSEGIRGACLNKHEQCVEWTAKGECEANSKYMTTNCAPACHTCHLLIFEERCPWNPTNDTNIWNAGDLDAMFERILTPKFTEKYEIEVLSRPPDGPWVVTLDKFLSDEETDRLIELGGNKGYDKSMDVGTLQPDGTYSDYESPDRTSTNTWCLNTCYEDTLTKAVIAKIEDVTGIPDAYAEYLQLLKYNVGQKYGQHHDYIPHMLNRSEGVRVATLFLYLNDVEAGGGTNFPLLGNLTVMPKKGKALLWPSVLNDDPNAKDGRTDHEALPVEAGMKYGANAWLHNRDFKETYGRGCA